MILKIKNLLRYKGFGFINLNLYFLKNVKITDFKPS